MSQLSVTELKAQVETDLTEVALQQIINSAERDIDEYIGPPSGYEYEYDGLELLNDLRLPKEASTITSVVEYTGDESVPEKTTLASSDFDLSETGWNIRRRSDGTNPGTYWGWHLDVIFEPAADIDRRKQAAIKLSRLEIEHSAYESEKIGDWTEKHKDEKKERAAILSSLDDSLID